MDGYVVVVCGVPEDWGGSFGEDSASDMLTVSHSYVKLEESRCAQDGLETLVWVYFQGFRGEFAEAGSLRE
jgi:hypothetical protein